MYYLLRSGTAHDPHTGQFTSSAEHWSKEAAKHAALVKSEPHAAVEHIKNTHAASVKASEYAQSVIMDPRAYKKAYKHAEEAKREYEKAVLHHVLGVTHADLAKTFSANGLTARHNHDQVLGDHAIGTTFSLHDSSGKKVGSITRDWHKDEKTGEKSVYHAHFELNRAYQNKGTAKEILKNSVSLYKQQGVQKITLEAGLDVGRYVWAKLGFTATPQTVAFFRDKFMDHVKNTKLLPTQKTAAIAEISKMQTMREIANYRISDEHLGKQFLVGSERHLPRWKGVMHLKDGDPGYEHFKKELGL